MLMRALDERLSEWGQVHPILERALEVILILHMDHEQNASTSTVRTAGELPFQTPKSSIWGSTHLREVAWGAGFQGKQFVTLQDKV